MSLVALTVERYRCFEHTQTMDLRPITVLLGRNNSGKSTLARLPLLLATGIRTTSEAPVEVEPATLGIDLAGEFTDLIFGQRPHGSVVFGLAYSDNEYGSIEFESTVQHVDEYQIQVVSNFEMRIGSGERELRLTWNLDDPRTASS